MAPTECRNVHIMSITSLFTADRFLCAVKVLEKAHIVKEKKEKYVMTEKEVRRPV